MLQKKYPREDKMKIKTRLSELTVLSADGKDFLYNATGERIGEGNILYSTHTTDNPNFIEAQNTKPEVGMYLILISDKKLAYQSSQITQIIDS